MTRKVGDMSEAYFTVLTDGDDELLEPTPASASGWSAGHVRGPAVSALLARATERVACVTMPDKRPVRWTVDLFRPAGMLPTRVSTEIIRQGRRIGLVDAEMSQNGKPVARSRALFALPGDNPDGQVWAACRTLQPPPPDLSPLPGEPRMYHSDHLGWTADADDHLGSGHKQTWHIPVPIVAGEQPTPFQMVAGVADVTNLVVSWGSAGVEFINADITLAMTRLPVAMEVGLSATDRFVDEGIAVGTAVVFDRAGPFGATTVTTLANARNRVDFGSARSLPD